MMMMMTEATTQKTLTQWEAELPEAPAPVAAYIPARREGNLIFTSGMLPMVNGEMKYTGRVGSEVTVEEAQAAARLCIMNALSVIKAQIGSLSNITRVVKVVGFVCGTETFAQHPQVINGASNALTEVLGMEVGQHARSAVGVYNLPLNSPVEVEIIVAVKA
jgi:enamine deaminase RidA (YjgF/YER057c/UK114 family)